jgi:leucyl-tRNA synthetase
VLHLLYSRFWHKVLYDRGHVQTKEPFQRLVNQGMILGENEFTGYRNADEQWVSASDVTENESKKPVLKSDTSIELRSVTLQPDQIDKQGDSFVLVADPDIRIDSRAYKMSKARGNVVNPDAVVADYGADALRLYEMFMGPLEQSKPWSMSGVSGVKGFLDRVWRMVVDEKADEAQLHPSVGDHEPSEEQTRMLHQTIKAVSNDIEKLSFNTAIARMMEFVNFFTREEKRPAEFMKQFVLILSPLAPHLCEELWKLLGNANSLAYESWPEFDEALTVESTIEIPVQIMGKLRAKIMVARGTSKDDLEAAALANDRIKELLDGKTIRKSIVVPDRLVNFVAN